MFYDSVCKTNGTSGLTRFGLRRIILIIFEEVHKSMLHAEYQRFRLYECTVFEKVLL